MTRSDKDIKDIKAEIERNKKTIAELRQQVKKAEERRALMAEVARQLREIDVLKTRITGRPTGIPVGVSIPLNTRSLDTYTESLKTDPKIKPLPEGTKFEDISIKFLNGHDVQILLKGKYHCQTDFYGLGFNDGRKKKDKLPNETWGILRTMSLNEGLLDDDIIAKSKQGKLTKSRTIKSILTKSLKKAFGIQDDPFTKLGNCVCKAKFKLIPEEGLDPQNSDKISPWTEEEGRSIVNRWENKSR